MAGQSAEETFGEMDVEITLGVLSGIERDQSITQRGLATDLGIAVGMVNLYLKRCVTKGLIKIGQAPSKRYIYYLTPIGFLEKSRLTAHYLHCSFNLFRNAREQYEALFAECARRRLYKVALLGRSELAEIAVLSAAESHVAIAGLVDAGGGGGSFLGLPVLTGLESLGEAEAVVLTALTAAQACYDDAAARLGAERVFAPPLLGISHNRRAEG